MRSRPVTLLDSNVQPAYFGEAARDDGKGVSTLMGLRNDPSKGLQGDANYQVVATGNRTNAFTCGAGQSLFAVVTFGTAKPAAGQLLARPSRRSAL